MSFTSLWYFPFLIMVALISHILPSRPKIYFLLAVSWIMYGLFGLPHFLLMLLATVVTYLAGRMIARGGKWKIPALAGAVIIVAGILFYMKYFDMFLSGVEAVGGILGRDLTFPERNIILPVGISFYTFQSLTYVVDVYRGEPAEKNFARYALFISFFPQLVAGPIEKAGWLVPQLKSCRASAEDVRAGIRYILSGCVRKFVIADYMAGFVDTVYGNVSGESGLNLLAATVLFAFQIYCDFSGYTHIAIGSARFLGIRLTENFDQPYLARGCRDFWKRWHITLTRFFTEYVYIPLGGNRRGAGRKYFNIMVVFLLSGLWHGADMTFLCWGAFFGIWRILEEVSTKKIRRIEGKHITQFSVKHKRFISRIETATTFALVCLAWVFFRSQSMTEAAEVFARVFTAAGGSVFLMTGTEMLGAAARIGILALLPRILDVRSGESEKTEISILYIDTVILFLTVVCLLAAFGSGGESSFIYFQF